MYKVTINCEELITYTEPKEGSKRRSSPNPVPENAEKTGGIHSHGNYDEDYLGEEFSPDDYLSARIEHIPLYVSTPSGKLIKYDPKSEPVYNPNKSPGKVKEVPSATIPSDPKSPNRTNNVSPDPSVKVEIK